MLAAGKGIEADFYERLNVYMTMGIAFLAICVLIWLVLRIRTWFLESDDSDEPLAEMLTQFRQLKREGELTEEEYRLISQRLSGTRTVTTSIERLEPPSPIVCSTESEESADPPVD